MTLKNMLNRLVRSGCLPDALLRHGIRRLLRKRVAAINSEQNGHMEIANQRMVALMKEKPLTKLLNEAGKPQYEQPPDFFIHSLGQHLNFSCGLWPEHVSTLDGAETEALMMICKRAKIQDGMAILELGAAWGALSVFMAIEYPNSHITSVARSTTQEEYIIGVVNRLKLSNITVTRSDVDEFESSDKFDRVVSIEIFEHIRYWQALFEKISHWLDADGLFFMQIFAHKNTPYFFDEDGQSAAWMTDDYLAKGLMPSLQLPLMFGDDLLVEQHWQIPGEYYRKTADAWLKKMDKNKNSAKSQIESSSGKREARELWVRWRLFYMTNSELFGYNQGSEWLVGQYLLCKPN